MSELDTDKEILFSLLNKNPFTTSKSAVMMDFSQKLTYVYRNYLILINILQS